MATPKSVRDAMKRYRDRLRLRDPEGYKEANRRQWHDYMRRTPSQREKKRQYDRERYRRLKENANKKDT